MTVDLDDRRIHDRMCKRRLIHLQTVSGISRYMPYEVKIFQKDMKARVKTPTKLTFIRQNTTYSGLGCQPDRHGLTILCRIHEVRQRHHIRFVRQRIAPSAGVDHMEFVQLQIRQRNSHGGRKDRCICSLALNANATTAL